MPSRIGMMQVFGQRHWVPAFAGTAKICVTGFCLCLLSFLVACSRKTDGREVVTFWAMGYEAEVVAQLIPEFERQNPGIRVDLQQLPWLSAHEKLLTAFAGESLPDVTPIGNTWIPEFAALGALDPRLRGDDENLCNGLVLAPAFFSGCLQPKDRQP